MAAAVPPKAIPAVQNEKYFKKGKQIMKRRILAMLLAVLMIVSLFPTSAFATYDEAPVEEIVTELPEEEPTGEPEAEPEGEPEEETPSAEVVFIETEAVEVESPMLEAGEAPVWTGEGTSASPYQIATLADLEALATAVKNGEGYEGKYFKLTADIGSESAPFTTPIGTYIGDGTGGFFGIFDGNNHTVYLNMNDAGDYFGLFGYIGQYWPEGQTAYGTVKNVIVDGTVQGNSGNFAGVCGCNDGIIENCVNNAEIKGVDVSIFGGVCAYNNEGTVNNCINNGAVSGTNASSFGGVCGVNSTTDAAVTGCVNTGAVTGTSSSAFGGICGEASADLDHEEFSTITNCLNVGVVTGDSNSRDYAGICGSVGSINDQIINSYTIKIVKTGEGTVTSSAVKQQNSYLVTVAATPAAGYTLKSITSSDVTLSENTFTMSNSDVTVTVVFEEAAPAVTYVAQIGTTQYPTLAAAIAAANANDTIELLENISYDAFNAEDGISAAVVIPSTKNITLDLKGKTIEGTSAANAAAYLFHNKGYLTIMDSAGNGKITFKSNGPDGTYSYGTSTILNRGVLKVESGTIENTTVGGASYAVDNQTLWYDDIIPVRFFLQGGNIECTTGDAAIRQGAGCGTIYTKGGEIVKNYITISAGKVTGDIWIQNLLASYTDIQITGGEITGKVYDTAGDVTNEVMQISGGRFGGKIEARSGKTGFVSGGVFTDVAKTGTNVTVLAEGKIFVPNTDPETKTAYPWTIGDAAAPEVVVDEPSTEEKEKIISDVTKDVSAEKKEIVENAAEDAVEAIVKNTEVTKADTKVEKAVKTPNSAIIERANTQSESTVFTDENSNTTTKIEVKLETIAVDAQSVATATQIAQITVNTAVYDVTPIATVTTTVTTAQGTETKTETVELTNDDLNGNPVTVRLAVPGTNATKAKVTHKSAGYDDEVFYANIQGESPNQFVEIQLTHFSEVEVQVLDGETQNPVAAINTTGYATLQAAVNAVQNNETIVMLCNVTVDSEIAVPDGKTFTIDLNDTTLTTTAVTGFSINAANLTVKNGTVKNTNTSGNSGSTMEARTKAFFLWKDGTGSLTLDGVTVESTGYSINSDNNNKSNGSKNKTITIKDCDITSAKWAAIYAGGADNSNELSITNSKLTSTYNSTSFAALQICMKATLEKTTVTNSYGGAVSCFENVDLLVKGTENVLAGKCEALATSGNYQGSKIKIEGGTFTCNGDIAVYLPGGDTVTIDGGTFTGNTAIAVKGGNVTINGGTFTANGVAADPLNGGHSGAKLTGDAIYVEDNYGNSNGFNHAVTLTVNGGTFTSTNGYALSARFVDTDDTAPAQITVNGGQFKSANGKAVFYTGNDFAGTITASAGHFSVAPASEFVAAGKAVIDDTAEYKALGYNYTIGAAPVCKIGDVTYTSLAAAVEAVPTDGTETTIVMIANETIAGNAGVTIPAGKNVVLDLAGFTVKNNVTQSAASQTILNKGTLTIKDSTDTAKDGTGTGVLTNDSVDPENAGNWWIEPKKNFVTNVITNHGKLTIESGKLMQNAPGNICYCVDNQSSGASPELIVNGGHLYNFYTNAVRVDALSKTYTNTMTVNGGVISGYSPIWLQTTVAGQLATLNITGGTINSTDKNGGTTYIYNDGTSTATEINISGGTFNDGVQLCAGTCKISGGTFNKQMYLSGNTEISGGTFNGGITSYLGYYTGSAQNMVINGGTFNARINIYDYYGNSKTTQITGGKFANEVYAIYYVGDSGYYSKCISGGVFKYDTYSDDSGMYWLKSIAPMYVEVLNEDPLTKADYPYTVGKVSVEYKYTYGGADYYEYFADLQDAFDCAANFQSQGATDNVITLLDNIDYGVLDSKTTGAKVNAGQSVTLDLNGFTVSGTKTDKDKNVYVIKNLGTLTVEDNSINKTGKILLDQDTTVWNYSTDGVAIENHGALTINSGTIEATRTSTGMIYAIDNRVAWEGTVPSLTVNGGTIKSGYAAIRAYAQNNNGTDDIETVVNGGSIVSDWAFFLQDGDDSTNTIDVEVNGGTFDSGKDMFFLGLCSENVAKITISEAEDKSIVSDNDRSVVTYDYDGAKNKVELVIESGKFAFPADAFIRQVNYSDNAPESGAAISGGYYTNVVPADCIVPGYVCINTPETDSNHEAYPYTIGVAVAQIVETGAQFATLQEAIDAATAGQTVQLLANINYGNDVKFGAEVAAEKDIILDLNGHKLEATRVAESSTTIIKNNGKLKVVDSAETKGIMIMHSTTDADPFSVTCNAIYNYGEVIVDGAHIESSEARASYAIDTVKGSMTVISGKIVGSYCAFRAYAQQGDVTFNIRGGEFIGNHGMFVQNSEENHTLTGTITGGEFKGNKTAGYIWTKTGSSEKTEITVNGGMFKGGEYDVNGGSNNVDTLFCADVGTVVLKDGFFTLNTYYDFTEEEYVSLNGLCDTGKQVIDTPEGAERTDGYIYTIGVAPVAPSVDPKVEENSKAEVPTGENVEEGLAEKVIEEVIGEIKQNTAVSAEGATNIQDTDVAAALKAEIEGMVDSSSQLKITVKSVASTTTVTTISAISASTITTTNAKYDVKPYVTIETTEGGVKTTETRQITNAELKAAHDADSSFTLKFRLAVPDSMKSDKVLVKHYANGNMVDWSDMYDVKTENGKRYVELEAWQFSEYEIVDLIAQGYVAINVTKDIPYSTVAAINTAVSGDTVKMLKNVLTSGTADDTIAIEENPAALVLQPGVTLDLNGKIVTVTLAAVFGSVVDSSEICVIDSEAKTVNYTAPLGRLIVNKQSCMFYNGSVETGSKQIPVYVQETSGNGFEFVTITHFNGQWTKKDGKAAIQLNENAHYLTAEFFFAPYIGYIRSNPLWSGVLDAANISGVDVFLKLTYVGSAEYGGTRTFDLIYSDDLQNAFATDAANKVFSLNTIADVNVTKIIAQPYIKANGVYVYGNTYEATREATN